MGSEDKRQASAEKGTSHPSQQRKPGTSHNQRKKCKPLSLFCFQGFLLHVKCKKIERRKNEKTQNREHKKKYKKPPTRKNYA